MNPHHVNRALQLAETLFAESVFSKTPLANIYKKFEVYLCRNYISDLSNAHCKKDPLKIHWVDPHEIKYYSNSSFQKQEVPYRFGFGKVRSGDWDKSTRPVHPEANKMEDMNDYIVIGLYDRFSQGKEIEDTILYKECMNRINNHETVWRGCDSKEDVHRKFADYESSYHSIRNLGYQKQDALHPHRSILKNRRNEILVDIGRNDELLFVDGIHRLILAKILDCDEIPVVVLCRHQEYVYNC